MTHHNIQVGQTWAHRGTGRQVEVVAINPGNLLEIRHHDGGPFPNRRTTRPMAASLHRNYQLIHQPDEAQP